MVDASDLDRTVFDEYSEQVRLIAEIIADDLQGRTTYNAFDGREWCKENDVPESAFIEAVEWDLEGVDWGISSIRPFRVDDEVTVVDLEEEEVEEEESEDAEE